jgi:hypothetical protein
MAYPVLPVAVGPAIIMIFCPDKGVSFLYVIGVFESIGAFVFNVPQILLMQREYPALEGPELINTAGCMVAFLRKKRAMKYNLTA